MHSLYLHLLLFCNFISVIILFDLSLFYISQSQGMYVGKSLRCLTKYILRVERYINVIKIFEGNYHFLSFF